MGLAEQFKQHVRQENLFHAGDKLLLAVSGGIDSVVLAELCIQAGYPFSIAHCNFKLRGKESDRDAQFVKSLAEKYGVEYFSKEFDTQDYAAKNKLSIQEAARELRYNWFEELIQNPKLSIQNLLTAHHANDNIETVVMNFFRGTGLGGLKGIDAKSGRLIRPLLIFSKQQLIDFANENKLEFVEDSSNKSSKYTRNLFRNEIIPAIEKVFPGVTQNLFENIERFREIHNLYQFTTGRLIDKLVKISGDERRVPVKQLMEFDNRALIFQLIYPYGFTEKQVAEVEKLASAESGKFIQSPDKRYRIIRHRQWFIISPVNSAEVDHFVIETEGQTRCGEKNIAITRSAYSSQLIPDSLNIAMLDAKDLSFPMVLRKWKAGDYFYPLGMRKKKKLARLFIDLKLSKAAKEKVWVLESDKKILWVVCHRIDERFKITEKTKEVLKITFT
jgi:tRNA(Ile)-lysidine synthase